MKCDRVLQKFFTKSWKNTQTQKKRIKQKQKHERKKDDKDYEKL